MRRRSLLTAASTLVVPLAGCASGPPAADGVRDTSFRRTGDCPADESNAAVGVDGTTVTVEGCLTGPNGCARARLASATLDGDDLTLVVESFVPDSAEACTQALVGRAYRATVRLDAPPAAVRVVHRGVDGGTVATWP